MSVKFLRANVRHLLFIRKKINKPASDLSHYRFSSVSSKYSVLKSSWSDIKMEKQTLDQYVYEEWDSWSDRDALTCGVSGRSYTYGLLQIMIDRCAAALLAGVQLQPGERLAVLLPNIPEFAVVVHGALKAGIVVTLANPLHTADELKRQLVDCNVKSIATIEMFLPMVQEVSKSLKDYKGTIVIGEEDKKEKGVYSLKPLLLANYEAELPTLNPDDVCLIPYSSGTTGVPKGVMLTHNNLVYNLKQVHYPDFTKHNGERGVDETILVVPPYFHIYGFNGALNYCLALGFHTVSLPRFTPESYVKCLEDYKPTAIFVVPALLSFLATHPMVTSDHLQSVHTVTVGAASTSPGTFDKFLQKCKKTKDELTLLQGYGLTETSPVSLMTPYKYPHDKVGTVGQILPQIEARVVSIKTGEPLGPYEPGELWVRGPQVMKGYWNNEQATKETVDSEGWLRTGDVVYYDNEQFFYVVGRTKELIKVKGHQVSPTEIENILMELPEIADAAVIGVPDEKSGELPKAFVVFKPNHKLTEAEIYAVVAEKLAKYKRLDGGISFLDAIPRNASGKILRNELKALIGK